MSALGTSDLFAAGIGFDISGAYLLALGLLIEPKLMLAEAASVYGYNVANLVEASRDRARGLVGVTALAIGFSLQLIGYLVSIENVRRGSGWRAALVAIGVAAAAIGIVAVAAAPLVRRQTRRVLVRVALAKNDGAALDIVLLSRAAHHLGEERRVNETLGEALRRVYPLGELKFAFSGGLEDDRSPVWPSRS